ncbi:Phosphoribosyl transferase domain-containing protein [Pricia antarctica]|uniref:Phosphoribosyl transferase domain-containing protein n=1 Tax=Pricia antarctica TaxID=641691 RepID=A0A1G7CUG4_9FLAO|nr:phosphoribosyltransferase family protein [Pricia antarctica]SDE43002.1 Phosphoribosyl transferase domain-containing protein [Pricia antarctica]
MKLKDRNEAGKLLALKLAKYKNAKGIVLAVPRGGVPLGYIVSKALKLPLEIILSKKIGHPIHQEFAIGAATLKSRILSDAAREVSSAYIDKETIRIRQLLQKRYREYYGGAQANPTQG